MLTAILAALKASFAPHAKEIIWNAYCIVHLLDENYVEDGDLKDAAIDSVITLLEQHKSKPVIASPVNTNNVASS
jgi:hypothetical protein